MAGIAWRKSNLITTNLGINALVYLVPVLSLAWLFGLSQVGPISVGYLIVGASVIVVANLLVNLEAGHRGPVG